MSADEFARMFRRADWMERGACHALVETIGPEKRNRIFFPTQGESANRAKAICAECPVAAECLEYALDTPERYGIWGGTSEKERRVLRRERGLTAPTGGRVRRPIRHGENGSYKRCNQRPEGACDACKEAHAAYNAERKAERRGAA